MNIASVAVTSAIGLILVFFVFSNKKFNFFMFYLLLFLSLSRLSLDIGLGGTSSLRLPIAVVLLIGNMRRMMTVMGYLLKNGILFWSTLWFINVCISWYFSNDSNTFLFESVGNYLFFILSASYFFRANSAQIVTMLKIVGASQLPGILLGISSLRGIVEGFSFIWGTVYHQRSAQAGVYVLPLLLLLLDQSAKKRVKRLTWILGLIFSLFVLVATTGARTPTIVFGLILLYWFRDRGKYLLILTLFSVLGIYISTSIAPEEIGARYSRGYSAVISGDLDEAENVEFRYEHFVIGFEAFAESPVYGHGHDSWMGIMGDYKGLVGYSTAPHNELIRLLVEYGLMGVLFFVMYVYTCCKNTIRSGMETIPVSARYSFAVIIYGMILLNLFHNALFSRYLFFALGATAGLRLNNTFTGREPGVKSKRAQIGNLSEKWVN